MNTEDQYQKILNELEHKAGAKQQIYRKTRETFNLLKDEANNFAKVLHEDILSKDPSVEVSCREKGDFESHLKFGGDTLIFLMHTNVFNFPHEHYVHKTSYVKEDKMRAYCGMIMVYNFLSDSIKFNRINDTGTLIARIFVNKEGKFFVQGRKQFSIIYKEFGENTISAENIRLILQTAVLHAIDFDLLAPSMEMAQEITLMQKLQDTGHLAIKTGKRLGFETGEDTRDTPSSSGGSID